MTREKSTLSGKVIDAAGRAVAGATVVQHFVYDRPVIGLSSTTTDAKGQFKLDNVPVYRSRDDNIGSVSLRFAVIHADYPVASGEANQLPGDVKVTMPSGCVVTGTVTDSVTGRPAHGAAITARRSDEWNETVVASDADGHFRIVLPEGRYDFLAEMKDRVCVAVTGRECLPEKNVELPPFKLIEGGYISGQVINSVTKQPISVSDSGKTIMLGLIGPSRPGGRMISPARLAAVDKTGRFTLRAAPGENFPYFVNTHGVRMSWDTQRQPPVIVKNGETTAYNMLITPEVPPQEHLKAAQQIVEDLPKKPVDRTAQIILEFRKLNHTVDETELWCTLMRELVAIGRDAVPQLCAELDQTTENMMMRRLGFALRAIGDKRATPALIRAIPKSLVPACSDYGLIVKDAALTKFMQTHGLNSRPGGTYFNFGRPVRNNWRAACSDRPGFRRRRFVPDAPQ